MSLNFVMTSNGLIYITIGDEIYVVGKDHINYENIKSILDCANLVDLCDTIQNIKKNVDVSKTIEDYFGADISVENGEILYRGKPYNNKAVADRILELIQKGLPAMPMIRFLEWCEENPNPESIEQLWPWLEHAGLSISEEGEIIGFKYVNKVNDLELHHALREKYGCDVQYTDNYTHTMCYNPGMVTEMPRHEVQHNPFEGCSSGLHVGTYQYANRTTDTVMMVKVNPKDVVSVPTDCEHQKLRCCRFVCLSEADTDVLDENGFKSPIMTVNGVKVELPKPQSFPANSDVVEDSFDNESADHWDDDYDYCERCGEPEEDCVCCDICWEYPCVCDLDD